MYVAGMFESMGGCPSAVGKTLMKSYGRTRDADKLLGCSAVMYSMARIDGMVCVDQ
jgi:hypothetical protein